MRLLFDATRETMYPLAKEGFSGGSQVYIKAIIKGLAAKGHQVHVIANDLDVDEQRDGVYWWPANYHPTKFDVAVQQMHVNPNPRYEAPVLVLMTSCVDPWLGDNNEFAKAVDAVPVFSQVHKDLLCKMRPIAEDKCFITGLGVDVSDYDTPRGKVPGRMLYANDPARGLFYTLDVFDAVKKQVPEATLHVAYDFEKQFGYRCWEHSQMAQMLLDCKLRLESTPGVVSLGALTRAEIIQEQLECQVHCYPSDPPGIGTQIHGIMQMECAAAGAALVLSDVEAFPEVFSEAAVLLPTIGEFLPEQERRVDADDYAAIVVELMQNPDRFQKASQQARALAEQHTWDKVVDRWEDMLAKLVSNE
jgi:glycosyltransferase involved in cell wall biosynthesis